MVRAGPELHDRGDDEDRRHQPVHGVEGQGHVHQHHEARPEVRATCHRRLTPVELRVAVVVGRRPAPAARLLVPAGVAV